MPLLAFNLKEDILDAFRKLQEYAYFDNSDLHLRAQLVNFLTDDFEKSLKKLESCLLVNDKQYFDSLYSQIRLRYYPKNIENSINGREAIPSNFITNTFYKNKCDVSRLAIFCDIPIELHIVGILWIIRIGYRLDKKLQNSSYGNRLLLTNGKITPGRTLFKPYVKQYQKWWSNGINTAKELLNAKEDVTIVNFDLKDYFHSVQFDFNLLEQEVFKNSRAIVDNNLHKVFKQIHKSYSEKFSSLKHPALGNGNRTDLYPLPIGFLSSFILGNWYLSKLDITINKMLIPSFYGRYVDDVLIVLKGRLVRNLSIKDKVKLLAFLKDRGFDLTIHSKPINYLNYFFVKYLSGVAIPYAGSSLNSNADTIGYQIRLKGLDNLKLQEEKIFIYQFDSELSPGLITKFVEDQKERSSEFRFLSDQEDESFDEFDEYIFEDTFETNELNKARFKKVDDNRYKFSVYLAKLIQRKIERGRDYKTDEVEKVDKYFKGIFILKHFVFWEKLFTLYLVSGNKQLFIGLQKEIKQILNSITLKGPLQMDKSDLIKCLERHLEYSMQMALGLNPSFLYDEEGHSEIDIDPLFFRSKSYIRKQYVSLPFLHLIKGMKNSKYSFLDQSLIWNANWSTEDYVIQEEEFTPHRIKFYEAVLFIFFKKLQTEVSNVDKNMKRYYTDVFNNKVLLDEAYELFCNINVPYMSGQTRENLKREYYSVNRINAPQSANTKDYRRFELNEYYFKNGGASKEKYRVSLVNKYVDLKDYEASLDGNPRIDKERVETYYWILDQVKLVNKLDIFVLPELALPHQFLFKYIQFSAKNAKAFISGVEHIRTKNLGFNFVISCLPINVKGDKDSIPIIRLKNHYAPEEEEWMKNKGLVVPKPTPYRYDLFEWKGLFFSTYYCFELADIFHRTFFYSMLDLICAPVWNPDTHYYNNVVESTTRDMHCYVLQVNTSQYGDTRVTRPTDHIRKDKAKIKGGTVDDYKVTLLVSDIEVKKLRDFQKLEYNGQKDLNRDKKSFKPTPPDFPVENVIKRESNKRFGK